MITAHIKDSECNCTFTYNESKNSLDDMQWNYDYTCKNKDHLNYHIKIELNKSFKEVFKQWINK